MKKSIKKNYLYNLVYQILVALAPLITTPYTSRIFGVDGVGKVSFVESIVSYFVLIATLGITTYGQREISYYQDDVEKRSIAFFNIYILKFITSSFILFIYILTCLFCFQSKIYIIFAFNIIAVMFNITWFFQGLEEFKLIAIRNLIYKGLTIICIFVFVKEAKDLYKYCFILSFFTLFCEIAIIPYLKNYIKFINMANLKPFANLGTILSLFLPTVAIQIYTVFDKTMIGVITKDTLENGYYEQSTKISKFLLLIVTSIVTVASPRVGYYFSKKDINSLNVLLYKSYSFVLMLAIPMTLGLFVLSSNLIPWFLGSEFEKSILLTQVLSFLIIFIGISNITGLQYMVPVGKQKLLTISVLCGAVINFCLNIVLIKTLKSFGAAIASVVAESSITLIQFYLVRKEISLLKILQNAKKYFFAGILMFIVLKLFIVNKLQPSIISSFVICLIGGSIYFIVLFLVKDAFLMEIIGIISNRYIKRRQ